MNYFNAKVIFSAIKSSVGVQNIVVNEKFQLLEF